jgi:hypothetical protein
MKFLSFSEKMKKIGRTLPRGRGRNLPPQSLSHRAEEHANVPEFSLFLLRAHAQGVVHDEACSYAHARVAEFSHFFRFLCFLTVKTSIV